MSKNIDRMTNVLICASGGAFLGSLAGQMGGAVLGGTIAGLYGWWNYRPESKSTSLIIENKDRIRISAIDVEMDKHLAIVNRNNIANDLVLGSSGIGKQLSKEGYVATICASFGENPTIGFMGTQDLHVTRKQLVGLQKAIECFLKRNIHPFDPNLNDGREIWSGEVNNIEGSIVPVQILISDRTHPQGGSCRMVEIIPSEVLPEAAEQLLAEYGFGTDFEDWDAPNENCITGIIKYADKG
jgi:hypothetical protein